MSDSDIEREAPQTPTVHTKPSTGILAGVGCFSGVAGLFSGGMIAVLLAKVVDFFTKAPACPNVPSCHWLEFALVGAVLGAVSLPTLVIIRLRRTNS